MPALKHSAKLFCWILFLIFMALLTKNILFKKNPRYYKNYFNREYKHYKVKDGWAKANTKPFSTIRLFYNSRRLNTEYKTNNLLGNLIGFVPLGLLLPFIIPWFGNGFKILIAGFLISLGYETMQLLTGLGVFDVDDLILNTAGAFVGFILFYLIKLSLIPKTRKAPQ